MKNELFVMRDIKSGTYFRVMNFVNSSCAIRALADEVNDSNSMNPFYTHSSDYELYTFGSFDNETCKFDFSDAKFVVNMSALKTKSGE